MGSPWGKGDFCLGVGKLLLGGGNPRFPTPLYETLTYLELGLGRGECRPGPASASPLVSSAGWVIEDVQRGDLQVNLG